MNGERGAEAAGAAGAAGAATGAEAALSEEAKTGFALWLDRYRLLAWMAGMMVLLLVAIAIAASIEPADARKTLLERLLDWPVLGFALAMMLFGALGRDVLVLVRTRKVKFGQWLELGEHINEVAAEADDVTSALSDRIAKLERVVFASGGSVVGEKAPPRDGTLDDDVAFGGEAKSRGGDTKSAAEPDAPPPPPPPPGPAPTPRAKARDFMPSGERWEAQMFERLVESLRSSRFEWRSLERLGVENGLSEDEVLRLLRDYGQGEVRLSMGKSGRRIAKVTVPKR